MKTVDKALTVLDQFSFERTEVGLSELSRLSGLDKAATRRLLVALGKHGFIEQSSDTRKYRLGYGFLRLARIRERTVPLARAAQEVVHQLTEKTHETTHVSVPMSDSLATIAHQLPPRGNVINIIPAQPLPYHATAAGIAFMASATPETLKRILTIKREKVAAETLTSKSDLLKKINQTQADGYAHIRNSFEDGVAGIAMPFFLDQPDPAGTIAIALPVEKMTDARRAELLAPLREAIGWIEKVLTGLA